MTFVRRITLCALAVLAFSAVLAPAAQASRASTAALQVALRAVGLYNGSIDGIAGPWTKRGVRVFQSRKRLAVDGVVGPKTRRALGRRGRPRLGSRAMHKGQRGWDVAALQYLLHQRGFSAGGFDGGFGAMTDSAVRRFQSAVGLSSDGVAGPATLRALRTRRASAPAPGDPVRFLRPVSGRIGDGFGYPGGRKHTGLDFPQPMGARVGAAGRGVVAFVGWNSGGYGNLVVVRHRLGFESWYAHLSRFAVSRGQAVTGGTRIGSVGSTGRSTGPHLHFEVRRYGTPIDPRPRLLSLTAAMASPSAGSSGRRLVCRPNADARNTRDADPAVAHKDRCP